MNNALSIYLNDHLAGAEFAIELLGRLSASHPHDPLGTLAAKILVDVAADRDVLQELCATTDARGNDLKVTGAWVAERMSRLKLRLGSELGLGEFESIEMLSLGILGKLKMWQVLRSIISTELELSPLDFSRLISRAEQQHDTVEQFRLAMADDVFSAKPSPPS
jgi:hypothetical protein